MSAREALDTLTAAGDDAASRALLAYAPPRGGKTRFAFRVLLGALDRFGGSGAMMTVSNRTIADRLGDDVVRHLGASAQTRPVTTLSAIAFRVIADARFAAGLSAPRLINGAEQDALLRGVMAVHLAHARAGEPCAVCGLLRAYFASDDWAKAVGSSDDDGPEETRPAEGTTAGMFERGVSSAFVAQLRDMLARMDELGAFPEWEDQLIEAARAEGTYGERLELQWRLAFALRREYLAAIEQAYQGQYRLDASRLLVEGAAVLRDGTASGKGLPKLLVVDDFQDTTLAGLRFLEALADMGVRLLLVGNPDEAVQTFRGSYPEYLFRQAVEGSLGARIIRIEPEGPEEPEDDADAAEDAEDEPDAHPVTYRDIVAARVSLSIPSPLDDPTPLPDRPGKTPKLHGSWPIAPLDPKAKERSDESFASALYRSPREELDDVVWRIKRAKLDGRAQWNDMAVIAHDNNTVRTFGERLRRDGVPVRYSSVTRPLSEEPFVQGLFALIELARLRRQGLDGTDMTLRQIAAFARSRVATLMGGPLITVGARPGDGRPARVEIIDSAMKALESLSAVVGGVSENGDDHGNAAIADTADADEARTTLPALVRAWEDLTHAEAASTASAPVAVDDSLIDPSSSTDAPAFGVNALYAMLALDDPQAPADLALAAIGQVVGSDPQLKAFQRLWLLVDKVAQGLGELVSEEPQFTLALVWDATGVARVWQRAALENTAEGRAANDRLDTAMRLFQYAEGGTAGHDIVRFIAQVRAMQIEADSLAHIGPIEQAVTLTTPAGAAGRHWKFVWMPALQQDVWPNLAERNTMFGGEDLADIILYGGIAQGVTGPAAGNVGGPAHDPRLASVLSGEKKSLLVALTRADDTVMVSAVANDDTTPSDFLYGYLPEHFDRESARFTTVGEGGEFAGLDADPRGVVAAARIALATCPAGSAEARDAAMALALLAEHGVESADPDEWAYPPQTRIEEASGVGGEPAARIERPDEPASHPMASLSPSSVDRLWDCPVCWMLENTFAGPRPGSVATSFGTLIHAVAQRGSEEGLDRPNLMPEAARDDRLAAVTARLTAIYDELKPDTSAIDDPASRYNAIRKDEHAAETLSNIASYFVTSNEDDYLGANAKNFQVGRLEQASCEEAFAARFDLDDILAAYNATPGVEPVDRHRLALLMGTLVGGWPEGMSDDLIVRLTGRIDRKETRVMPGGGERIRLIDYKTGQVPGPRQIANDLQLVCYQLGLTFPERPAGTSGATFGLRGAEALAAAPVIGQCALFHVEHRVAPALSWAPEAFHQPPLFTRGSLNADGFTPRYHYPSIGKLLDMPALAPEIKPEGLDEVSDAQWRAFASLNDTQALWSLTMIARVFYTAAASRSEHLTAHPTDTHLQFCRMRTVCPACAGEVDTVFETRQA
ncbi:nuclease [Bifidobacterium callitrichos]|nr:nuclease [Bifidobacterium callitrichos]